MRWLPELEHHKVGDVDDVVDRSNAGGFDLRAQPGGTWADFDMVDLARGKERTFMQRRNLHAGFRSIDLRFRRQRLEFFFRQRCNLAGQSIMAEQIPAVRRDLDVENRVAWEKIDNRGANLCLRRQNQKPRRVFTELQLDCAAKHSFRFDSAKFALLDLQSVRQLRSRQRQRNLVAHLVILRAANDLALCCAPLITYADSETIRIGML